MSHTTLLESLDRIISNVTQARPELNSAQLGVFSQLSSLQALIRFMGSRISHEDTVVRELSTTISTATMNLDMEQSEWPFSLDEEQDILSAITSIESMLSSACPEPQSPAISARDMGSISSSNVKLSTYASGSLVHFHADHIAGNVEGSVLSHNNIRFDADPAVRQGMDNLIERAIDTERIQKHKEFLNWISKLNFQAIQVDTFAKHSPGTGEWFFKRPEFIDWRDEKTKFLWCPGIPGAGKTILSSIIIDHLRSISGPAPAVLYIYCDYTHKSDQTPTQLLGSILKQLVQYHPYISDHLLALHNSCSSQNTLPDVAELFTALKTETSFHECVYIIVDALDECPEDNQARELFFPTNSQGLWSLPDHVHLLVTSRDILSISQAFNNEPRIYIEAHQDDLQTYIKGRIITDVKLKRLVKGDTTLQAEIVDQVILKASGMFLQARLHLDALASQLNRKGVHMALSTLPKGIMDSYDAAMARISAQGEAENKLALQVFYWLAYAQEPLSVKELQHAVAVSEDMTDMDFDTIVDLDLLTGICAGLVIIFFDLSDHSSPIIQLVHYTTYEYFQLKQHQLCPNIHPLMAMTCLTYMSFDTFNSDDITQAIWKQYPLYRYAVLHWAKHAQQDEAAAFQHILKFLAKKKTNIPYVSVFRTFKKTGKSHILMLLGLHQTFEMILSKDATYAHALGEHGFTPLAYACLNGHINLVQLLLSREDINSSSINTNPGNPLLSAVQKGHMDIVKLLLQQPYIDTGVQDDAQRTPLSHVAEDGHLEIVKLLLERKYVTFIGRDNYHRTPLSYAAEKGHLEIVKLLHKWKYITFTRRDKYHRTPLSYAAENGHLEIVKLLLQWKYTTFIGRDKDHRTPLSYAAENGHIDVIKILLQQENIDPNIGTPLAYAAAHGHLEILKLLLDSKNVNPNACDLNQCTALAYAAQAGDIDMVNVLLQQPDIDPNASIMKPPLTYAAANGHLDTVQLLLAQKDINVNASDIYQMTSLGYAAMHGQFNIAKILVQKPDIDLSPTDRKQRTPLSYAAEKGHVDIVKLLLCHDNVNPDASGQDQKMPLAYAAQRGRLDIVRHLLQKEHVDPDSYDKYAHTPLSYTAEEGSFGHVEFKSYNKNHWTPLFYAAREGHVDIVRLLVEQKGVDPDLPDTSDQTPLVYAAEYGQFDVVQLLIKYSNQLSINSAFSIAISQKKDARFYRRRAPRENYFKIVKLLQEHATDS
ncbi:ankyrin repeat-containing domain protein [Mycena floridula]|nr:ankyrin repeat-containing domain protein [Mycena floridula]